MKKTFDASPMPNHKMIIGNKASGGTGRRSSTTGSTVSSIQRVLPTTIPRTIPPRGDVNIVPQDPALRKLPSRNADVDRRREEARVVEVKQQVQRADDLP